MSDVLKSLQLKKGVNLKNQIVMAPMTTWSANDDYTVSDQELNYYEFRNDGAGMIVTACARVQPNGIGFTNEFGIYDDRFLPNLTRMASKLKQQGAKAVIQLFHAGNKALPDLTNDLVSSGDVPMINTNTSPRSLSDSEIKAVIDDFGKATKRAIKAGFDGVEIHGAQGFLIQNFMSPYFNNRTDAWGGSLENRMRFPLAVINEVKRVVQKYADDNFIIGYRFSPDEPIKGGLKLSDNFVLIDEIINQKLDYVHASLENALQSKPADGNQTYLKLISQYIDGRIHLLAAGKITELAQAQEVLKQGALPAMGHAFITDPKWVAKVIEDEHYQINNYIESDKVSSLRLPDKLWQAIRTTPGWFEIK